MGFIDGKLTLISFSTAIYHEWVLIVDPRSFPEQFQDDRSLLLHFYFVPFEVAMRRSLSPLSLIYPFQLSKEWFFW